MSQNPNRQLRGTSHVGEFANKVNPESTPVLDDGVSLIDASSFMNDRVKQLRQHGYVSAITAPSLVDPRSSAHRKQWWDRHTAAGEFGNSDGGYPQMPDDWTPAHSFGASSPSSLRRTHRMAHVGDVDQALRKRERIARKMTRGDTVRFGDGHCRTFR